MDRFTDATAPAAANKAFSKLFVKRIPAKRLGTVDGLAVYLASGASRDHMGDAVRVVDGGYAIF